MYPNYTHPKEQARVSLQRTEYLNRLKADRKNMDHSNTLILAVVGESPYAEFVGDVNTPYCQKSVFPSDSCLYDNTLNAYAPPKQKKTLQLSFDQFD